MDIGVNKSVFLMLHEDNTFPRCDVSLLLYVVIRHECDKTFHNYGVSFIPNRMTITTGHFFGP